jgi:hypothetical protein
MRLLMLRLRFLIRHFCLLPSCSLTMYPVALEAVLRAKVALFSQLLAVRTLQRACVVLAVLARALSWGVCGHGARELRIVDVCEVCGRDFGSVW